MKDARLKELMPQAANYKAPPYTVEAPGVQKAEGETIPRRNVRTKDELWVVPEQGVDTVYALLRHACAKYGNAKALGKRKLKKMHHETTTSTRTVDGQVQEVPKQWHYYELSDYHYQSFVEFERSCLAVGSALQAMGVQNPDRVHIFAATHPHWLAFAHGAWSRNVPIVTVYDTLGEEGLKHSLLQTNPKAVFVDPGNISKLINPLREAKAVRYVIYNDDESPVCMVDPDTLAADVKKLRQSHPHLTVTSFSDMVRSGEKEVTPIPPKAEDLACIMYTSGSTGAPKGVLLTHRNVIGAVAGLHAVVGPYVGPGDRLLTFLPLAHIFELVFECACLFWGGTMGYGHPKTLSDTSVKNCRGDIVEYKPTIMVGVPAVWESVKKGIMTKVGKLNPVARNVFWGALSAKTVLMPYLAGIGLGASLIDNIVFKRIREATGGCLRITMSGGGPLAKETQNFLSMTVAPMISGYGLTETAAMGVLTDPIAWTTAALGEVTGSVEIKLVDFEDAGYYSTNMPPQGEIWIRGAAVANGYLDLPEESAEAFTKDGWFKTGDIGEFDKSGNLRVIDRKKNLVKTLNGEYIALEKLESIYRSCAAVANLCVYAAPEKSRPAAIVSVLERAVFQIAKDNGVAGEANVCQNSKVKAAVLKELQAVGRAAGLAAFEIVDGVVLTEDEWTPQNGLVTSAQKLNRRGLMEKYSEIKKA